MLTLREPTSSLITRRREARDVSVCRPRPISYLRDLQPPPVPPHPLLLLMAKSPLWLPLSLPFGVSPRDPARESQRIFVLPICLSLPPLSTSPSRECPLLSRRSVARLPYLGHIYCPHALDYVFSDFIDDSHHAFSNGMAVSYF